MKRNLINLMKSAIALADALNFSRAAKSFTSAPLPHPYLRLRSLLTHHLAVRTCRLSRNV